MVSKDFCIDAYGWILECIRHGEEIPLDVNGEATYVKWLLLGKDERNEELVVVLSDYILERLCATVRVVPRIKDMDLDEWLGMKREVEEAVRDYWFGWEWEPPTFEGIVQTIISVLKKYAVSGG